ncbi:hypothetical protein [Corallococcus macrosporus]|uniref:Uncharacterized protein n=1 Tax=Myxococcus fulvus (strain ATCC BAA-855 / HW-1) TaxID=483219 RepID=F8C8M6_MYXFH|nr:hypothetical protein [Corallococcus macrosporus]AEI63173.1 hypothetical protein LILAB_06270 [Corallococcus macrosporus]
MDHDEFVRHAVRIAESADRRAIELAWLESLVTRDLLRRSVWPRFLFLQHLPEHDFDPSREFQPVYCRICGMRETGIERDEAEYRADSPWVRPVSAESAVVAVECVREVAQFDPEMVVAGREVLGRMLDAIRALPAEAQLTDLVRSVSGVVKGNKRERIALLETLGFAELLPVAGHRGYAEAFVPWDHANSRMPSEVFKREWAYPVRFWTGADGVASAPPGTLTLG